MSDGKAHHIGFVDDAKLNANAAPRTRSSTARYDDGGERWRLGEDWHIPQEGTRRTRHHGGQATSVELPRSRAGQRPRGRDEGFAGGVEAAPQASDLSVARRSFELVGGDTERRGLTGRERRVAVRGPQAMKRVKERHASRLRDRGYAMQCVADSLWITRSGRGMRGRCGLQPPQSSAAKPRFSAPIPWFSGGRVRVEGVAGSERGPAQREREPTPSESVDAVGPKCVGER